jgi:hypothetical protein
MGGLRFRDSGFSAGAFAKAALKREMGRSDMIDLFGG